MDKNEEQLKELKQMNVRLEFQTKMINLLLEELKQINKTLKEK